MAISNELTEKQMQVYTVISSFIEAKGYSPTFREVADQIGVSSSNSVHHYIEVLERKGYIVRDTFVTRSIRLTEKRPE